MAYLNNSIVFEWLKYNGITKGNIVEFSEKPIASIPFRAIDWTNTLEIELHQNITATTKQFIETKQEILLEKINDLFNTLFNLN